MPNVISNGTVMLQKNARSAATRNERTHLFQMPATDMSIQASREVRINPQTTGITPISFEFTSSSYLDLSKSYIELELQVKNAGNGANWAAATRTHLVNNLAHSIFKQLVVRLHGTLITPQTDHYHQLAFIETVLNHSKEDTEDKLECQGFYDCFDMPDDGDADEFTANQQDTTHADFAALPEDRKRAVLARVKFLAGNRVVMRFTPALEVFRLSRLLVPNVQIQLELYLHNPDMWCIRYHDAVGGRMTEADISARLVLQQVSLQPNVDLEIRNKRNKGASVSYPVVRSAIRTFSHTRTKRDFQVQDPFYKQVPNRLIVALVRQAAFNGDVRYNPFTYELYNLQTVTLTINGEEYPYTTLELNHDNGNKDVRGYHRFLQATGCLTSGRGNLIKKKDWGYGKKACLLAFDLTANKAVDTPVLNPEQTGDVVLKIHFGNDAPYDLTVLVYGEFENVIEINSIGAVTYDIHG